MHFENIIVRSGKLLHKISAKSILFIEVTGEGRCIIKTTDGRYPVNHSMRQVLQNLDDDLFVQCHRSFAVNVQQLTGLAGNLAIFQKSTVPVGPAYLPQLYRRFAEPAREISF